jgi:hypothetical protein
MSVLTSGLSTALGDRYTIERQPGEGDMATVHLAEDVIEELEKIPIEVDSWKVETPGRIV